MDYILLILNILINLVRPGVLLAFANFFLFVMELIKLDFPTFERPMKAYSTLPSCGHMLGRGALMQNSDFLIFGHHSPVYKKTFGLSFENMPKAVITCDAACEYMTEEFTAVLGSLNTIHEPSGWCVKTDQNGNCTIIE